MSYGRRLRRKKDRWIRGYIAWPLPEDKAFTTFSVSKKAVEDMILIKTGKTPEALGLSILKAEVALRVYEKRVLLTSDHKLKG